MLTKTEPPQGDGLAYPFAEPPATGAFIEVAPGILWIRIPLPFRLDHVNIYLIEDGDGWAVLDTGIANQATRDVWEGLVAGPLAGRRLTRLIVTHFHPDHIGLAGWLCERYGLPLLTSQTCYLGCINISLSPGSMGDKTYRDFYRSHGMADETADLVPVLFPRKLDPHQLSFAFSETHAHVNSMVRRGELAWEKARADLMRVRPG